MSINLRRYLNRPVVWFILVLMGAMLWLIFNHRTLRDWTSTYYREFETMEGLGTTYTFYPDKDMPNISFPVSPESLKHESLALLRFFKARKDLVSKEGPKTAKDAIASFQRSSPPASRPKIPDIDFDVLKDSLKREKFTDTSEYGDTDFTQLDVYKKYDALKTKETELLSTTFDRFFDVAVWRNSRGNEDTLRAEFVREMGSLADVYSYVKYYVIQKRTNKTYVPDAFPNYLFDLMEKNRTSSARLAEIKDTVLKIVKPTFVFLRFFKEFKANAERYNQKVDALFFVNTAMETITDASIEGLKKSAGNYVYTFKDDDADYSNVVIHYDGLYMANTLTVIWSLYKLVRDQSPNFVMSRETFFENYSKYIASNAKEKIAGVFRFLAKPDTPALVLPPATK